MLKFDYLDYGWGQFFTGLSIKNTSTNSDSLHAIPGNNSIYAIPSILMYGVVFLIMLLVHAVFSGDFLLGMLYFICIPILIYASKVISAYGERKSIEFLCRHGYKNYEEISK